MNRKDVVAGAESRLHHSTTGGIFITTSTRCYDNSDCDLWTINYLIDAMKIQLATIQQRLTQGDGSSKDNNGDRQFDSRKYYDKAHSMLKIGVFRPVPSYTIHLSDLTPKIIRELYQSRCPGPWVCIKTSSWSHF